MNNTAVVLIDFINEIVDPKGKLSGKGYAAFAATHDTMAKVGLLLATARSSGMPVIHVRVGFSPEYQEQPLQSPLFGGAKKFGALLLGTWATEFHPSAVPLPSELIVQKHRVSAFFNTSLDLILRNNNITNVLICGVATDLAVQSAAKDAHDRDYAVTVLADCCIAASDKDHDEAIRMISKVAAITDIETYRSATAHP